MARKYNLSENVDWKEVLKSIEFRSNWFYYHFEDIHKDIQVEFDRKHPRMDKLKLWSSFAYSYCRDFFYWLAVYQSVRRFVSLPERIPKEYDMELLNRFFFEEYKKTDPVSYAELEASHDTESNESIPRE